MYLADLKQKSLNSAEWIRLINEKHYTPQELAYIYCCVLTWEDYNLTDPQNLLEVTRAFLARGMKPDEVVYDEDPYYDNYLDGRGFPSTPLLAVNDFYVDWSACAESMKCLLECGGDPNTSFEEMGMDGKPQTCIVPECYYQDVWAHGPYLDERDFYGLLLCFAYGGVYEDGNRPFEMLIDAPPSIFKNYNGYWYEYEADSHSGPMYVIEKKTRKKVAKCFF